MFHFLLPGRFAQVKYSETCQKGVRAKMRTNRLPSSPVGRCVTFVYYLHGDGVGSLELQMKELTSVEGISVWTRDGDQGKGWHQGTAFIPPGRYAYQVNLDSYCSQVGGHTTEGASKGHCLSFPEKKPISFILIFCALLSRFCPLAVISLKSLC